MSFDDPIERFRDIVANIERIEHYTDGMSYEIFQKDLRTRDAVERCLSRISEAAVKLDRMSNIAAELCPTVPWADIRGIGNHLRHAYDAVDTDEIWNVVERDLAPLKAAVLSAIAKSGRGSRN